MIIYKDSGIQLLINACIFIYTDSEECTHSKCVHIRTRIHMRIDVHILCKYKCMHNNCALTIKIKLQKQTHMSVPCCAVICRVNVSYAHDQFPSQACLRIQMTSIISLCAGHVLRCLIHGTCTDAVTDALGFCSLVFSNQSQFKTSRCSCQIK